MVRVCVRRYLIAWVPPRFAAHTRVRIGPNEHYFVNDNDRPAIVPASRSKKLVGEFEMGSVDGEAAAEAVRRVNLMFEPGTYHVVWRNCVVYSYVLCCALFGREHTAATFPRDANQLVCLGNGWGDFMPLEDGRLAGVWQGVVWRHRLAGAVEALAEAAVPHADDE